MATGLDPALREVEALCARRSWDELVTHRNSCRAAYDRGEQLWPAAAYADYRLALEAPARWAAAVVAEGSPRFSLGPLAEVAASTHTWEELEPHLPAGPERALTAHERVVRGEDLRGADIDTSVLDIPLSLEPWESAYAVATYAADGAEFPTPETPPLASLELPRAPHPVTDREAIDALIGLAATWTAQSNGRVEAVAVDGSASHAVAALGVPRARMAPVDVGLALALMAWAAASGGAYGRRRGMAAGRFEAWWVTECLGAPPTELRWYRWDAWEPATGWQLHLAVEDPETNAAWAVAASDAA